MNSSSIFYERVKTFHPSLQSVDIVAVNNELRLFSPAARNDDILRNYFVPLVIIPPSSSATNLSSDEENKSDQSEREKEQDQKLASFFQEEVAVSEEDDLVVHRLHAENTSSKNNQEITFIVSRLSDPTRSVRSLCRSFTVVVDGEEMKSISATRVLIRKNLLVIIVNHSFVHVFDIFHHHDGNDTQNNAKSSDCFFKFQTEHKSGTVTSAAISDEYLALSRTILVEDDEENNQVKASTTIIELYAIQVVPAEQIQLLLRPNHQHQKKRKSPRLLTYFTSEDLYFASTSSSVHEKPLLSEQLCMCFITSQNDTTNNHNNHQVEQSQKSFPHPLLASFDKVSSKILLWDLERAKRNMSSSLLRGSIDVLNSSKTDEEKKSSLSSPKLEVVELISSEKPGSASSSNCTSQKTTTVVRWSFLSFSWVSASSSLLFREFSLFEPLNWRKIEVEMPLHQSDDKVSKLCTILPSSSVRSAFCSFKRISSAVPKVTIIDKTGNDEKQRKWDDDIEKNLNFFIGLRAGGKSHDDNDDNSNQQSLFDHQMWKVAVRGEPDSTMNLNLKLSCEFVREISLKKDLRLSSSNNADKKLSLRSCFVSPFNPENFIVRWYHDGSTANVNGKMTTLTTTNVYALCWGKKVQGTPLECRSRIRSMKVGPRATTIYLEDEGGQSYTMRVE